MRQQAPGWGESVLTRRPLVMADRLQHPWARGRCLASEMFPDTHSQKNSQSRGQNPPLVINVWSHSPTIPRPESCARSEGRVP